jgi:hypothetical protein
LFDDNRLYDGVHFFIALKRREREREREKKKKVLVISEDHLYKWLTPALYYKKCHTHIDFIYKLIY